MTIILLYKIPDKLAHLKKKNICEKKSPKFEINTHLLVPSIKSILETNSFAQKSS